MKILAIVDSLTGNTMSFVEYVKETFGDKISIEIASPKDPQLKEKIKENKNIMIGCYTWDSGKIPIKTKRFVIANRDDLLQKNVLIFGSGWSIYENFCKAVDSVGIILEKKFPEIKYELRFDSKVELDSIQTLKNYIGDVN